MEILSFYCCGGIGKDRCSEPEGTGVSVKENNMCKEAHEFHFEKEVDIDATTQGMSCLAINGHILSTMRQALKKPELRFSDIPCDHKWMEEDGSYGGKFGLFDHCQAAKRSCGHRTACSLRFPLCEFYSNVGQFDKK